MGIFRNASCSVTAVIKRSSVWARYSDRAFACAETVSSSCAFCSRRAAISAVSPCICASSSSARSRRSTSSSPVHWYSRLSRRISSIRFCTIAYRWGSKSMPSRRLRHSEAMSASSMPAAASRSPSTANSARMSENGDSSSAAASVSSTAEPSASSPSIASAAACNAAAMLSACCSRFSSSSSASSSPCSSPSSSTSATSAFSCCRRCALSCSCFAR